MIKYGLKFKPYYTHGNETCTRCKRPQAVSQSWSSRASAPSLLFPGWRSPFTHQSVSWHVLRCVGSPQNTRKRTPSARLYTRWFKDLIKVSYWFLGQLWARPAACRVPCLSLGRRWSWTRLHNLQGNSNLYFTLYCLAQQWQMTTSKYPRLCK